MNTARKVLQDKIESLQATRLELATQRTSLYEKRLNLTTEEMLSEVYTICSEEIQKYQDALDDIQSKIDYTFELLQEIRNYNEVEDQKEEEAILAIDCWKNDQ